MPLTSETVAIPVVKGLDVTTDTRLVSAPSLLEARNTQFAGGGAKKRQGHTSLLVRTEEDILLETVEGDWVYGMGLNGERNEDELTPYLVGRNPKLGQLRGVFTRDAESVVWDGFRLVSYLPSQLEAQAPISAEVDGSATFASLRATPVAKFNEHQGFPEIAQNTLTRIVAWVNEDNEARYAVYDVTTSALIAQGTLAVTSASYLRAFTLGEWMHVLALDSDDHKVKLFSISSKACNDIAFRSYGDADNFDLFKVDETKAALARVYNGIIHVSFIGVSGTGHHETGFPAEYDPSTYQVTDPSLVAIAVTHTGDVAVVYANAIRIGLAVWVDGALHTPGFFAQANVTKITLGPKWIVTDVPHLGRVGYDIYWESDVGVHHAFGWPNAPEGEETNFSEVHTRYHLKLVSRAWGVGDRTFVWAGQDSDFQSCFFLLDEGLLPAGKAFFGSANVDGAIAPSLRGVNFVGDSYQECHLALDAKTRVAPDDSQKALSDVYTEPTIQLISLDFLPSLSAAQAGRTTYIAGAQLWAYDGQEIVEAGFHLGPEPTYTISSGGSLTSPGTYFYRVDLCHRNAQNEEVRSLSILSGPQEITGTDQTVELSIPTVLTRREDSYFLIYRNAMSSGTPLVNWWLLNSRDPASSDYLSNDLTLAQATYIDDGTVGDEDIQTRELHPASDTWVQPISAPACEVLASGRDRLWVAGGELAPGVVAPSRLFGPGEVPAFNDYLNIQVDRGLAPITAIGFIGEIGAIFREKGVYLLDSDGPDNNASGFWNPVRLALPDSGALSSNAIARIAQGLVFLSPSGFRVLGPGGAFTPLIEVDTLARSFSPVGVVINQVGNEVRFYGTDSTLVYNYLYNTWATWTCFGIGAVQGPSGALLAQEDGCLWVETPSVYTDAGAAYSQRIRTSWLHGGNIGDFQRVRWVQGVGRYTTPHNLRLELYYDEREFWEERIEWSMPDEDTNQDTWGAASWGSGSWGDTTTVINNLEDLTWDWERRPARQKCSSISISLEDVNTDGPGFELSAFALDVARKEGFNRLVARGGSDSNRGQ